MINEKRIILLIVILIFFTSCSSSTKMPDLLGVEEKDAVRVLEDMGIGVEIEYVYPTEEKGAVISTDPKSGEIIDPLKSVTLEVEGGQRYVFAEDSIIYWYHFGYGNDNWNLSNPIINVSSDELSIGLAADIETEGEIENFGSAIFNDVDDKSTSIEFDKNAYLKTGVGHETDFEVSIPISHLNKMAPTNVTLYISLRDKNGAQLFTTLEFTIRWPSDIY